MSSGLPRPPHEAGAFSLLRISCPHHLRGTGDYCGHHLGAFSPRQFSAAWALALLGRESYTGERGAVQRCARCGGWVEIILQARSAA